MIRNTLLFEIKNVLNLDKNFSDADFKILPQRNTLTITYEYDNTFLFQVNIPDEISKLTRREKEMVALTISKEKDVQYEAYEFSGKMVPGVLSLEEKLAFEGKFNLMKYIRMWLENLWAEINIQPEHRNMQKIEEDINNIKAKFDTISDDYFTKEEAEKLKERLDKLEADFKQQLELEIHDKDILIQTLSDLHIELEKLKGQTRVVNKKNWFKSFSVKMFIWLTKEENRKFLKDAGNLIKPLLPESIDKIL